MWGTNTIDLSIAALALWVWSARSLLMITTRMAGHGVMLPHVLYAQRDRSERMLEHAKGR